MYEVRQNTPFCSLRRQLRPHLVSS